LDRGTCGGPCRIFIWGLLWPYGCVGRRPKRPALRRGRHAAVGEAAMASVGDRPAVGAPGQGTRRGAADAAEEVVEYYRLLYLRGQTTLLSGNISVRVGDLVAITPTSAPKPLLRPSDLVYIDLEGRVVGGSGAPSSEWRMHVAIYRRRPDVGAVVHTHAVLPTVLAERIDAGLLLESESYLGGGIAVVPPLKPGTWELAEAVAEALSRANVAVMKKHGVVAVGPTLAEAVNRAEVVNDLAWATLARLWLGGGP